MLQGVATVSLLELSSPGCLQCKQFEVFWERTKGQFPNVELRKVDVTTPEGQQLAQEHMILASPGIIINGALFSTGGVPEARLVAKLQELSS